MKLLTLLEKFGETLRKFRWLLAVLAIATVVFSPEWRPVGAGFLMVFLIGRILERLGR